jgi:hypothetical protein
MRSLLVVFLVSFLLVSQGVSAQCRADSVFTYRVVGGSNQIASIEYFLFDENDSIIKKSLLEIHDGKALPVNEMGIRYFKAGSTLCVEYESRNWVAERGIYRADSKHTQVRTKKGLLIAEKYDKIGAAVTPESESIYTYNKSGQLITNEFKRWDEASKSWKMESRVAYFYSGALQTESITYQRDTVQNSWKEDWKIIFSYDSLNELSETVSYQFKNGAWVPRSRTVYGKEADKPVKWNLVQEWSGSKENWVNQFYYVFQLDAKGFTEKEIHLDWVNKEWKINMAYQYVYNDSGMLVQILSETGQVIMDRFCKN